jgi:hypothetical protein
LAGLGAGVYTLSAAAQSSGLDRVVASVIGVLSLAGGVLFFAALVVLRHERPRTSKVRISPERGGWPARPPGAHGGGPEDEQ